MEDRITHQLSKMGFEPLAPKQITANSITRICYPNIFRIVKGLSDVNGVSFVYRGFFFETSTYFAKYALEYYLTDRISLPQFSGVTCEKNVPKSLKEFYEWLKSRKLTDEVKRTLNCVSEFLSHNLPWIIPNILFYPANGNQLFIFQI